MSKFSYFYSDLIYSLQQLISQPATRRSVAFAGAAGFTIVELLIVIVVIGILAAIVIVAYTGITGSANEAAVKSDLGSISRKLEEFKIRTSSTGVYPGSVAELDAIGFRFSQGSYAIRNNLYYYRSEDKLHYAVGAVAKTGASYFLVDGTMQQVANGSVYGAPTMAKIDTASVDDNGDGTVDNVWGTTGFSDPASGGTGWQVWTQ